MYVKRKLASSIKRKLSQNKLVVLFGARQTGKTTFIRSLMSDLKGRKLRVNADEKMYAEVLSSRNLQQLKGLVEGYDILFIDEAQRIPEIGLNLKLLHDEIPELKVIVTGSSSFDLSGKINEPLTGRKQIYQMFPLSMQEMLYTGNRFELNQRLNEFLIYGMYPEVCMLTNISDKADALYEIGDSYLLKDVTELQNLKHETKLRHLLQLLAYQIGSEVSVNELSKRLQISRDAVNNYLSLLEKAFVIFRLGGYSRNLRKEVTKMDKYYFYDNGIRNMLIDNLKVLDFRNDIGQLWENFIVSERKKYLSNSNIRSSPYFWRIYTGAELDYIEEGNETLKAWEIKYSKKTKRPHQSFIQAYPNAKTYYVTKDNYWEFIS
ncbi:MAG: ATP-binding protein [Bacteroidales bacterium]|jgi:predicted AAA+ superfamily ATPase|nr:ATP-binding protein [Bacteroidales bacterium]